MWSVKDGRLYWRRDLIAVRRVVVELVMGRRKGPPSDDMVRTMVRMERALSLRNLTDELGSGISR